jgi:hypothetical protein
MTAMYASAGFQPEAMTAKRTDDWHVYKSFTDALEQVSYQ